MHRETFSRRTTVRRDWVRAAALAIGIGSCTGVAQAVPYTPADDGIVIASVPPGARHTEVAARVMAKERIDVALPLAQLYIKQARSTGDMRFLGFADAMLSAWIAPSTSSAQALVLHATVLQSRHEFSQALGVLERALVLRPDDAQAWLTRATVLRVLGRYDESMAACDEVARRADAAITELCRLGLRGLSGQLPSAYAQMERISPQEMSSEERAWRASELGEMAVRLGTDSEAEHWFQSGLRYSPEDFYIRAAYADLLLRNARARDVLGLLQGRESFEPLLLRIAIAQKMLRDPGLAQSRARLRAAFAAETQRGDSVHRREQSRFYLDVENDPQKALNAALENWKVQREVEDVLVLLRAARGAGSLEAAYPAVEFVKAHGLQDVRIAALRESRT